jgi:aryl-alcohol dehydrogenase (NADP+)
MDYRQPTPGGLRFSRLCLGTMTFGSPVSQSDATRMLERCIEAGIDFVDTANAYGRGLAESMLGAAMGGMRNKLVVASKIGMKMGDGPDDAGLSRAAIVKAVEASLQRLQTDHLDICFLHQPDYATSFDETLEAMSGLVRDGKVRCVGTSNYSSWQVCRMYWIAERNHCPAPAFAQQMYSLIARGIEQEFLPMARELGVSVSVYNPLAGGLLTGKHRRETIVAGGRFDLMRNYIDRYWHPQHFAAVEQLRKIAAESGHSLIGLALNWLLHHTGVDCVVLGASRLEHLEANLKACDEGPLPPEAVAACDAVWQELRCGVPVYNR